METKNNKSMQFHTKTEISLYMERYFFLWTPWYRISFFQDSLINRKFKRTVFIWTINLFRSITNVLIVMHPFFNWHHYFYFKLHYLLFFLYSPTIWQGCPKIFLILETARLKKKKRKLKNYFSAMYIKHSSAVKGQGNIAVIQRVSLPSGRLARKLELAHLPVS